MSKSVVIIGGGLGGLFTGAFLAKEGFEITVLEKNATIGGGLQTFVRNGVTFETGMHILGGFQRGGSLYKICSYLGILNKLSIRNVDADCMDSITYFDSGETYEIAGGKENFIECLSRKFPQEKEHIEAYVNCLYTLANEVNLFYLRRENSQINSHSEYFFWPADKLIAHYIKNPKLRDILSYMNPMYGGVAGHTPAYINALINVLYIDGTSRFNGGSRQLADALANVIIDAGGRVHTNKTVTRIAVDNHCVNFAQTADGETFKADYYISDIHPCALLDIVDQNAFTKAYSNRLNEIPNSYSAFMIYIIFNENSFPYINHTCYYQKSFGMSWNLNEFDEENWPLGFMYMTPPNINQGAFAQKMIINCIMNFSEVERWKNTKVGSRGAEYEAWKQKCVNKVLDRMETLHAGFKNCVKHVYSASPLTIRDYYNVKNGSMYGFRKDCQNISLSQLLVFTKVRNLLLTGQNINLHGICGVPLTSINTTEAIVGQNVIIDKINKNYEDN